MTGSKSFNSKLTLLAERAMKVGCHSGDEQTKKWMLALAVRLHYTELPSAQSLYDKVQDLKRSCIAEFKHLYAEFVDEYPDRAEEIPKAIFANAYADEAPHPVELSGLNAIAEAIPLRKNSRLLKKGKPLTERLNAEEALNHATKTDDDDVGKQPVVKQEQVKREPPMVKQECVKREDVVKDELDSSDDEEVIMLKLKLAKQRVKRERLSTSPSASPVRASGSAVSVSRSEDGGFHLTSLPKAEVKEEPKAGVKEEPKAEDEDVPKHEDLDEWTKAAIDALKKRNMKKAEADKAAGAGHKTKTEDDAAGNDAATGKNGGAMKRPSSAMKRPAASIKHEPPKKISKAETIRAIEPQYKMKPKMPVMPKNGSSPKPVRYWGGVIYTARASKKFRALKVAGNNYTEASASWGGEKPTQASWNKCLDAIHSHYK